MAIKKVHINITIDEDLNEWLGQMAEELRLNKSQFMNNVIYSAKTNVKVLKAIGMFQLVKAAAKVMDKVSSTTPESVLPQEQENG